MSKFLEMKDGHRIALDEHGHLENPQEWNESVAGAMADMDGQTLSEAHWVVIGILRDYYQDFEIEPPMRALVKEMKVRGSGNHAGSLELYRLFPEGPVKQGSRYAGLPIPLSCI
jgi:tRNA 2-thiouridine synthesizing protein E